MKSEIQNFINEKRYLLYGVSQTSSKFGNYIYKELTLKGKILLPIYHKPLDEIKTYSKITDLPFIPENVIICTNPNNVKNIIDELLNYKIKSIWLQQGSQTIENINYAISKGLKVIAGKCILMYSEPVKSIHSFHRMITKIFGKY